MVNILAGLFLFAVFVGLIIVSLGWLLLYPVLLIPVFAVCLLLYWHYVKNKKSEPIQKPEPDEAILRKASRDKQLAAFLKH